MPLDSDSEIRCITISFIKCDAVILLSWYSA